MPEEARPRTNTRLRGEAPPGLQFTGEEGRQRIGRYEVIKTIGKGAMGVVYKARDPLLDRVVAVKTIMSPQGQGRRVRSAFLERFQREAKAAAKMQHPAKATRVPPRAPRRGGAPAAGGALLAPGREDPPAGCVVPGWGGRRGAGAAFMVPRSPPGWVPPPPGRRSS